MPRYIDTDILAKIVFDKWQECDELKHIIPAIRDAVMCASTDDMVELKRGRWIVDEDGNIECSVCGHQGVGDLYCERCGARMEGGEQ